MRGKGAHERYKAFMGWEVCEENGVLAQYVLRGNSWEGFKEISLISGKDLKPRPLPGVTRSAEVTPGNDLGALANNRDLTHLPRENAPNPASAPSFRGATITVLPRNKAQRRNRSIGLLGPAHCAQGRIKGMHCVRRRQGAWNGAQTFCDASTLKFWGVCSFWGQKTHVRKSRTHKDRQMRP